MKPATEEWIRKAEAGFCSACRERAVKPEPNLDLVCFLAQQCAEKYLKARLMEAERPFPRTHDLGFLLNLIGEIEPEWDQIRPGLSDLSSMGIEVRYPGLWASGEEADNALEIAKRVRIIVRPALGLE